MYQREKERVRMREGEKEAGRMRAMEEYPSVDSDNNTVVEAVTSKIECGVVEYDVRSTQSLWRVYRGHERESAQHTTNLSSTILSLSPLH